MKFKVGIDVGGTFTDFLLMDGRGGPVATERLVGLIKTEAKR